MQRGQTLVERVHRQRVEPMVPCAYSEGVVDRWHGRIQSCGALIPYAPRANCPSCGRHQARANAPHPHADSWVLDGDTAIIDAESGEVVVLYVECAQDLATRLAESLRNVVWDRDIYNKNTSTTTRVSGLTITHRTFGYAPPAPMRRRYACCRSSFNALYPKAMDVLTEVCKVAEHVFRTQAEDVYERTAQAVVNKQIPAAWRIAGTPWTSGIINRTAALPYHRDQANIARSWSAMLGCRKDVDGGLLHLADYDVYLPVRHGSISIFDGHSVVHGVTPITLVKQNGWRYTTVTYAKHAMRVCAPNPADEPARAKRQTTIYEDERATFETAAAPRKRR